MPDTDPIAAAEAAADSLDTIGALYDTHEFAYAAEELIDGAAAIRTVVAEHNRLIALHNKAYLTLLKAAGARPLNIDELAEAVVAELQAARERIAELEHEQAKGGA